MIVSASCASLACERSGKIVARSDMLTPLARYNTRAGCGGELCLPACLPALGDIWVPSGASGALWAILGASWRLRRPSWGLLRYRPSARLPACLPARLPAYVRACARACFPACLPACLGSHLGAFWGLWGHPGASWRLRRPSWGEGGE